MRILGHADAAFLDVDAARELLVLVSWLQRWLPYLGARRLAVGMLWTSLFIVRFDLNMLLSALIRIKFQEFPEDVQQDGNSNIIKHKLILSKYDIVQLIFSQYIYLIIFNLFLFELRFWFVEFLEKLHQLLLHSRSFPNSSDV